MMLSSRVTKPMRSSRNASPTKKSTIARPRAILTICCFSVGLSGLQEEFHLDAGQFDDVVVLERMRRRADFLSVRGGAPRAFDMRDEVSLRTPGEHGDLHARLAERREGLGEFELLAGVAPREKLDRTEGLSRFSRGGRSRSGRRGRRGGACILVRDTGCRGACRTRLHGRLPLRPRGP